MQNIDLHQNFNDTIYSLLNKIRNIFLIFIFLIGKMSFVYPRTSLGAFIGLVYEMNQYQFDEP